MSTITIAGNLTRDPELRNVNGGQERRQLLDRREPALGRQDNGATQEAVTYLDVIAWGAMAEHVAASLRTGDRALVTGRLEQRSWEAQTAPPHQARACRHRGRSQPALRRGLRHPGRPGPSLSPTTT